MSSTATVTLRRRLAFRHETLEWKSASDREWGLSQGRVHPGELAAAMSQVGRREGLCKAALAANSAR